jgi:hypothetical protein
MLLAGLAPFLKAEALMMTTGPEEMYRLVDVGGDEEAGNWKEIRHK